MGLPRRCERIRSGSFPRAPMRTRAAATARRVAHDYLREHRAHAEMSDNQSVEATRRAHSVSIGEVSSRTHTQGESEDHFEASSREFTNHNQCHAVTFLFYRINKTETIKFELVSIERRVLDPVTPMPVPANPFRPLGQVARSRRRFRRRISSASRRSTAASKAIERSRRRRSRRCRARATSPVSSCVGFGTAAAGLGDQTPLADALRDRLWRFVDEQLVKQGLLDKSAVLQPPRPRRKWGTQRPTSIPTAGVIVKACLDDCSACEPELEKKIDLELQRLDLQNKLLAKQIELLEKSQDTAAVRVPTEERVRRRSSA